MPMKRSREGSPKHNPNVGKWVQGKILGKGAFGKVHMATLEPGSRYNGLPPIMAVKSTGFSKYKELLNEKNCLDLLVDSPFVIRCFEDITITRNPQKRFNLLLEYASGGSLEDVIRSGLPEPSVKQYTKPILRGVQCIHERGIVHRDLKPNNILMVKEDDRLVPKIADFGLAKRVDDNTVAGLLMYFAPEIVRIWRQDQASDIWALGCIVLEMLTGEKPWDVEETEEELEEKIKYEIPTIPSWISFEAKDFLLKCFTRNPDDRPSADKLLSHPFVCGHEIIDLTSENEEEEEDPCEKVAIVINLTSEKEEEEKDPCEKAVIVIDLTTEKEEEDSFEDHEEEKCSSLTHENYEDEIRHPRHKRTILSRPICPQPPPVFALESVRWDQDQLKVPTLFDKLLFAFTPKSAHGVPICFYPRNGRSLLPYKDGSLIYLDSEPKEENLNLENAYYSDMKDAGFFNADWE